MLITISLLNLIDNPYITPNLYSFINAFASSYYVIFFGFFGEISVEKSRLKTIQSGVYSCSYYGGGIIVAILFNIWNTERYAIYIVTVGTLVAVCANFSFIHDSPKQLHEKGKISNFFKCLQEITQQNSRKDVTVDTFIDLCAGDGDVNKGKEENQSNSSTKGNEFKVGYKNIRDLINTSVRYNTAAHELYLTQEQFLISDHFKVLNSRISIASRTSFLSATNVSPRTNKSENNQTQSEQKSVLGNFKMILTKIPCKFLAMIICYAASNMLFYGLTLSAEDLGITNIGVNIV